MEGECLDDDSIVRFLSGRLDTSARASIERHVDACATCAQLILPSGSRPVARRAHGAHAFSPRDLIAGRYRIERLIGRGGMGEVYSALDEQLGERVALKTVAAAIADDARAIARLKSEVQLARRVTHPNVCRIYDLGIHPAVAGRGSDLAFLTMELLPGTTLAEEIRSRGALPDETVRAVIRHLIAGLTAAHHAGVIHKDFKSDNVMLVAPPGTASVSTSFARAVITDFGLAATEALSLPRSDHRSEFSGTPGYLAPERLRGAPATPASDVYALGVVLLDMLEGHVPARPTSSAGGSGPLSGADLGGLALRCCDDRPEARPTIDALAALLTRIERPEARRWKRATAFVGGAAMLATAAGFLLRSPTPASAERGPAVSQRASAPVPERSPPTQMPHATAPLPLRAVAALPANPTVPPTRKPPVSRPRAQAPASVAAVAHETPPAAPEATTTPATSKNEESPAQRGDEPIRSLDVPVPPTKAQSVTLGGRDDAPINPFANPR